MAAAPLLNGCNVTLPLDMIKHCRAGAPPAILRPATGAVVALQCRGL